MDTMQNQLATCGSGSSFVPVAFFVNIHQQICLTPDYGDPCFVCWKTTKQDMFRWVCQDNRGFSLSFDLAASK